MVAKYEEENIFFEKLKDFRQWESLEKSERGNRDGLYTVYRENGHDVKTYQKQGSQAYTRLTVQTTYDQSIINGELENLMIL